MFFLGILSIQWTIRRDRPSDTRQSIDWCDRPIGHVAFMLARPLHVSKVSQSKEKEKTKQATLESDFHALGSKSSLWPKCVERWRHQQLPELAPSRFQDSSPHWRYVRRQPSRTRFSHPWSVSAF